MELIDKTGYVIINVNTNTSQSIEMSLFEPGKSPEQLRKTQIFKKLYVCSEFLRALNPEIREEEIRPSVADPSEIVFRDSRLIVKDLRLVSAYSPRNSVTKLNQHILSRSVSDLADEYAVVEMSMDELVANISRKLDFLTRQHPVSRRRNQDLLLRVELRNCRLLGSQELAVLTVFEAMGWRSISVVVDRLAKVLYASERAPVWMRHNLGRVYATPCN